MPNNKNPENKGNEPFKSDVSLTNENPENRVNEPFKSPENENQENRVNAPFKPPENSLTNGNQKDSKGNDSKEIEILGNEPSEEGEITLTLEKIKEIIKEVSHPLSDYDVETIVVDVDVDLAKQLLMNNVGNRTLRESVVKGISQVLNEGHWKLSPQGIVISKTGKVIDGQHRLYAIIKSGKTEKMVISIGWPDDIFEVLDCGISRNISDRVIVDADPKTNSSLVNITKYVCAIQERVSGRSSNVMRFSAQYIYSQWEIYKEIILWIEAIKTDLRKEKRHQRFFTDRFISALMVLYVFYEPDEGRKFTERLLSGVSEDSNDGPSLMREFVVRDDKRIKPKQRQQRYFFFINRYHEKKLIKRQGSDTVPFFFKRGV